MNNIMLNIIKLNNTKWLASNGTINGNFINKLVNIVLRNEELIIIETS